MALAEAAPSLVSATAMYSSELNLNLPVRKRKNDVPVTPLQVMAAHS